MKQASTMFLRGVIALIAVVVLAACVFTMPALVRGNLDEYTPVLVGLYIATIPFCVALYQALKLLGYIDKNEAFSQLSVRTLKHIKYCAIIIGGFFSAGLPYVFMVADQDDAPGVVLIGLVIVFASFVVATFAAVLQKLVQNAVDLKSENDLTV